VFAERYRRTLFDGPLHEGVRKGMFLEDQGPREHERGFQTLVLQVGLTVIAITVPTASRLNLDARVNSALHHLGNLLGRGRVGDGRRSNIVLKVVSPYVGELEDGVAGEGDIGRTDGGGQTSLQLGGRVSHGVERSAITWTPFPTRDVFVARTRRTGCWRGTIAREGGTVKLIEQ
jgi:hypothetical protein